MEQQLSPKADAILKMAKILAWVEIDTSVTVDAVWDSQRASTRKYWTRQAALVLQEWTK